MHLLAWARCCWHCSMHFVQQWAGCRRQQRCGGICVVDHLRGVLLGSFRAQQLPAGAGTVSVHLARVLGACSVRTVSAVSSAACLMQSAQGGCRQCGRLRKTLGNCYKAFLRLMLTGAAVPGVLRTRHSCPFF